MKKLFPAKALLTQNSSPLDSLSLFNAMYLAGLLEEKEYVSSTGSGEIKRYHSLTEDGLKFGMNKSSPYSEKTELVFYPATFKALLVLASGEILTHSESL